MSPDLGDAIPLEQLPGHKMAPELRLLAAERAALANDLVAQQRFVLEALERYGPTYRDNQSRKPRLRVRLMISAAQLHLMVHPQDYAGAIAHLEAALRAGPPELTYGPEDCSARKLLVKYYTAAGNLAAAQSHREILERLGISVDVTEPAASDEAPG